MEITQMNAGPFNSISLLNCFVPFIWAWPHPGRVPLFFVILHCFVFVHVLRLLLLSIVYCTVLFLSLFSVYCCCLLSIALFCLLSIVDFY